MTLPPYATLLDARVERAGDGAPILSMPFSDKVVGRPGFVHGGAIAGLLEMAALVALQEAVVAEGGGGVEPVTITVDYMRGGRDKPTYAAGAIIRLGTRIANMEATAWQDDRARPIAGARVTYLITRP